MPVELTRLPLLEKLYLDNNKLSTLPSELGDLKNLKVLSVDNNMLVSVPGKFRILVFLPPLKGKNLSVLSYDHIDLFKVQ